MKEQLTVRLEPAVLRAAREQARLQQISISAVVADAATEALIGHQQDGPEAKMLLLLERLSNQLYKLTRTQRVESAVVKEMLGLFVRAYFNHTPPIPEPSLEPALLSGKARYQRFLDALAKNLRSGRTSVEGIPEGSDAEAATHPVSPASECEAASAPHSSQSPSNEVTHA